MHKNLSVVTFPLLSSLTVSGILIFSHNQVLAQVTPDNTLGDESSVVNTRDATSDSIDGGAVRGQNLFHSFEEFNVGEDRGVYFANPDTVTNIFSRVTGNDVSNILGTLGVDGAANLFLINPNGIVFGEGASLDVQGSFAATTADGIEFGEQGFFSASDPESPSLLTINPSAYLFNQVAPGAIANQSRTANPLNNLLVGLQVQPGKNLSLIGGEVSLDGGVIFAPGGRVELGGLNTAGTIGINADSSLSFPENIERGNVFLSNGSAVSVLSGGGGSIAINSQNLELTEGSVLFAGIAAGLGSKDTQAGDIVISATDKVSFDGVGANGLPSGIYSNVFNQGVGNTGNIEITTGDLSFTNGGKILSTLEGTGNLGNITINASNNISLDGVGITNVPSGSSIANQIAPTGSGGTGNINISARNFSLTNGASIQSSNLGKGTPGNINIDANDTILVDGSLEPFISTISSSVPDTGVGDAGGINLNSNNLVLTNGGGITSLTSGKGNSGNITINARNNISLDGESKVKVNNDPLRSKISTFVQKEGNSGNIDINTQNLSLTNGTSISSAVLSKGNAGDINITATNSVSVDGQGSKQGSVSSIGSELTEDAIGNEGNIKVTTGSLSISNNGGIFGTSTGKGNGASITIEAKDEVFLDKGNISSSIPKLSTSSEEKDLSEGNAGDIKITAKKVSLVNNSSLTSGSTGKGNGGDIKIDTTEKFFLDRSLISNSVIGGSFFDPNSGNNINFFGEGNSGNIDIKSGQILLDNNARIATFNTGIGNAGNILIEASNIFSASNGSTLESNIGQPDGTPATGKVGNIAISAENASFINGAALGAGFRPNTMGESGTVSIKVTDNLSFDNSIISTGVELGVIANGSDISLEANSISITNNSKLITSILGVAGQTHQITKTKL